MTPDERVRLFLDAMTAWEPRAQRALTSGPRGAEWEAVRAALRVIYDEHLSDKAKGPGRFGKNLTGPGPAVQDPPKFDQEIERIEPGSKKSVFYVVTRPRRDPNTAWRFTVVMDANGIVKVDDLRGAAKKDGVVVGEWAKLGY